MGLAYTGISHPSKTANVLFGWASAISSITKSGATITITPRSTLNYIKFNYFATQGDRLQAFFLQASVAASIAVQTTFPFDYNTLVKWDSSNLPEQVYVGIFPSGVSFSPKDLKRIIAVVAPLALGFFGLEIQSISSAKQYADIYG